MTAIPNGEVSSTKLTTAFGRAGCGMKFYYRYIEGLRGPVTANLLAGIAFDEATRQFHDNLQVGEIVADPRDIFIDKLENPPETNKDGEVVEYDLSAAPDDLDQRGLNALSSYTEANKNIKPITTQKFVKVGFNETDATLIGWIDLVEEHKGGAVITDVKTSLSPRKKWTAEDATLDTQLSIYWLLYDQNVGAMDAEPVAMGWRYARLGGNVEVGSVHVKPPNRTLIMQRLSTWINELERWCETGVFPPTGLDKDKWVCSEKYCDYYNRCPYGSKSQTTHIVQIGA
jgi:RecB family exonuclease